MTTFNDEDNPSGDTPFNMAMLFYMNLNDLIKAKDSAYMNNNIFLWFKYLDRIYNKIIFKLDTDERLSLENDFTKARDLLLNNSQKKEISEILHSIDKETVILMNKYKMIFPRIEMTYGLDRARSRYNIPIVKT